MWYRKSVSESIYADSFYFQGKFIRINFDSSGYISGANIETCILTRFYVNGIFIDNKIYSYSALPHH